MAISIHAAPNVTFIFGLGLPRMLALEVNIWFAAGGALILYASAYIGEVWRGAIERCFPKSMGGR